MSARLLADLETRVATAKSDSEKLLLRAKRAGLLAKLGRNAEARAELDSLRRTNSDYRPELAAWILFSEGLLEHFASLSPAALDRFQRAYAIGVGLGNKEIQWESAAWVATWEYQNGEIGRAYRRAYDLLASCNEPIHSAQSRASLVLADCLNSAGAREMALAKYADARRHAAAIGDLAMQSAVLHNQAADDLARLSLATALNMACDVEPVQVKLLVMSVANLDNGASIKSLPASVAVLRAQLATALGEWSNGVSAYDACLEQACREGHERLRAKFLAERALCLANCGSMQRAASDAVTAAPIVAHCENADDIAIAHGRLSATFELLAESERSTFHRELALQFHSQFKDQQRELLAVLV